jgi:hypothetical protein
MRPRGALALWTVLLLGAGLVAIDSTRDVAETASRQPAQSSQPAAASAAPAASRTPSRAPARPAASPSASRRPAVLGVRPIDVTSTGFLSWALLDRRTGWLIGSGNVSAPSDTMSMIKAWLAADYLRRAAERGEQPATSRLGLLSSMIRDSDNAAAETVYGLVGQRASIERLVSICRLTDSHPYHRPYWSNTVVSARDTARMGACLADGRAAGARWTPWLVNEMRHVRGVGNFGVRTALPADVAARVAIKNGWLLRDEDGLWHISCLAVSDEWSVGVLARYPGRLGMGYGTQLCRRVGQQLVARW